MKCQPPLSIHWFRRFWSTLSSTLTGILAFLFRCYSIGLQRSVDDCYKPGIGDKPTGNNDWPNQASTGQFTCPLREISRPGKALHTKIHWKHLWVKTEFIVKMLTMRTSRHAKDSCMFIEEQHRQKNSFNIFRCLKGHCPSCLSVGHIPQFRLHFSFVTDYALSRAGSSQTGRAFTYVHTQVGLPKRLNQTHVYKT